jgi:hypothetical protein
VANSDARFTFHAWVDVPIDLWGKPYKHPHCLSDGRSGYTPHQVCVTAAFVLVEGVAYPIEKDVCRIVELNATTVTLVIGPDDSTKLLQALTQKLHVAPTAMRVGVWSRFVPSYEIGTRAIADETVQPFKVGLPVSLLED